MPIQLTNMICCTYTYVSMEGSGNLVVSGNNLPMSCQFKQTWTTSTTENRFGGHSDVNIDLYNLASNFSNWPLFLDSSSSRYHSRACFRWSLISSTKFFTTLHGRSYSVHMHIYHSSLWYSHGEPACVWKQLLVRQTVGCHFSHCRVEPKPKCRAVFWLIKQL